MAIAFVQSNFTFGFGTSITAATVADPVSGNFAVACWTGRGPLTGSIQETIAGDCTYVKAVGTQDTFGPTTWGEIWYGPNLINNFGGGFAATSFIGSAVDQAIAIAEYSGIATSSPLDKTASGTNFSTAALTSATATTTQADELLIGMIGNEGGTRTVVPDATFTERQDGGLCSTEYSDKIVAATGAYTYSGTVSGANSVWVACIATFKATGGGGPTSPTTSSAFIKKREPLQQRMGPC